MTDPHTREREALEAAHSVCPCRGNIRRGPHPETRCVTDGTIHNPGHCACLPSKGGFPCLWPGHAALPAYGRAVREADKEAAQGGTREEVGERANDWLTGYYDGRIDAAAAIEALDRE